jgi:6-pyruvoyltetrahydropterin/6-carboxytetrahydropterin synthase
MPDAMITKEIGFDAGHRVPSHEGMCRNPHGHRYRVEVSCVGTIIEEEGHPAQGMLIDFSELKGLMNQYVHDVLDHGFIVYQYDLLMRYLFDPRCNTSLNDEMFEQALHFKIIVFPYIPTAENIARWIWEQLEAPIEGSFNEHLRLAQVDVWETPTSKATYGGD